MASYPNSIVALPTINNGDTSDASNINTPNAEVVAVETGLLNGFQHDLLPLNDDAKSLGSTSKRWLKGWFQDLDADGTAVFGGLVTAALQPLAQVTHSTTQSIVDGFYVAVIFDTDEINIGAIHNTVTNNSRITVPAGGDGRWRFDANIRFGANGGSTPVQSVKFRKNGTTDVGSESRLVYPGLTGSPTNQSCSVVVTLVATDYIEVMALQSSGSPLNISGVTRLFSSQLIAQRLL